MCHLGNANDLTRKDLVAIEMYEFVDHRSDIAIGHEAMSNAPQGVARSNDERVRCRNAFGCGLFSYCSAGEECAAKDTCHGCYQDHTTAEIGCI